MFFGQPSSLSRVIKNLSQTFEDKPSPYKKNKKLRTSEPSDAHMFVGPCVQLNVYRRTDARYGGQSRNARQTRWLLYTAPSQCGLDSKNSQQMLPAP